jgi:acetyltransferase-like isoleucine patch superfamily enzyme
MPVHDSRIADGSADEAYIRAAYDTALWDTGVLVRYTPERPLRSLELRLGAGARLRAGTVIYAGSEIGRGLDTGHNVVIREESVIGDDVYVSSNTVIDHGCRLGNDVRIESNCYISPSTVLEDGVVVGAGCTFTTDPHPCQAHGDTAEAPILRRGAWIGANVSILPGVVIGEDAVVVAGSVVSCSVPAGMVAAGIPARILGEVEVLGESAQPVAELPWSRFEAAATGGDPGLPQRWRGGLGAAPRYDPDEFLGVL